MQNHPYHIAIIGGGLSGSLTAINLLRNASAPLNVLLVEKYADNIQRGVAYHASARYLPLNVPVKKMTLVSADHHHFEKWIAANKDKYADAVPDASPDAFVSRGIYGHYIEDTFNETIAQLPSGVTVTQYVDEALAIDPPDKDGYCTLHFRDGFTKVKKVVLALGNFPPVNVPIADTNFFQSSNRYMPSAWDFKAVETVGKVEDVLVIGNGLSMLDVLLTLTRVAHTGQIHTLSRNGLLPRPHGPAVEIPIDIPKGTSALELFTALRQEIRIAEEKGHNWRTVLDSIRTQTPAIWQGLSTEEKQHFMRHLRHHWDVHRHRIPQSSQEAMDKLKADNRLFTHAGKLISLTEKDDRVEVVFKPKGAEETQTIMVYRVLNCTGPHPDFNRVPSALVKQLIESGQAKVDEMRIGFDADKNFAVKKADGTTSDYLYLVGPMLKASWWESVALREIRQQAEMLPKILFGTTDLNG